MAKANNVHIEDGLEGLVILENILVPSSNQGPILAVELGTLQAETFDKFFLFPELPLELRRMIWRCALPPSNHVPLNFYGAFVDGSFGITIHMCTLRPQLPTTLYANSESRTETSTQYHILFQQSSQIWTPPYKEKPLCLSPSRDSVYIDHQRLIGGSSFGLLYNWMDCIEAVHPSCLGAIKCLEIRNMLWYSPKAGQNLVQTLVRFRGLRKLDITIDKMGLPTNFDRLNQSVKTILEEWFKKHKNRFSDGKTPAVTVRHL